MGFVKRNGFKAGSGGSSSGGTAGQRYRDSKIRKIVFGGDSHTALGFSNDGNFFQARGHICWTMAMCAQKCDLVYNGIVPGFATSGITVQQFVDTYLADIINSDADTAVIHIGTNNFSEGKTALATAIEIRDLIWKPLRASGIRVIATTMLPLGISAPYQAFQVALSGYLRTYAAALSIEIADWSSILTVSGLDDGIANMAYFQDSPALHRNSLGNSLTARILAAVILPHLDTTVDPFAGLINVSNNPTWTGGPPPSNWSHTAQGGNTIDAQSYTAASDPSKWWHIEATQSANSLSEIVTFTDTIASYSGIKFRGLVELRVLTGQLKQPNFMAKLEGTTPIELRFNQVDAYANSGYFLPADGTVVIQTPDGLGNASSFNAYPYLGYGGTVKFEIRRMGVYQI